MKRCPTPSERAFRDRLEAAGITFKTQMILGSFILDFVIPDKMLVIEIDGSVHNEQRSYDAFRDRFIRKCGFKVVRVSNEAVATWDLGWVVSLKTFPERVFRSGLGKANSLRSEAIIQLREKRVV